MRNEAEERLAKQATIVASVVLGLAGTLVVLWVAAPAILLIFAGLLLTAVFSALARPLTWVGVPRKIAAIVVIVAVFLGCLAGILYGGVTLASQFNALWNQLGDQMRMISEMLVEAGLIKGSDDQIELQSLFPNPSGLFSSASTAIFSVLGILGNVFVVIFIALFIIAQPALYRRGFVSLFPQDKRERVDETTKMAAEELILWVCGTGISMVIVFVVTFAGLFLVGMPSAFLLALQAGLLAFIPTLGPFVAGIPIVLVGLSVSPSMALWGLGVYVLVQGVESNVSQPIAQRYTSALPPALTLGSQLVFGVLFGTLGVALAVPLLAVLLVFIRELYVHDTLGGPVPFGRSLKGKDE